MKLPIKVVLMYATLWLVTPGCDAQPKKPMKSLPKAPAKAVVDLPVPDRAEVEAANRPQVRPAGPAPAEPSDQTSATRSLEAKPPEPVQDNSGGLNWLDPDSQLPIEYWEVQYFNAQRIGMTHYKVQATGSMLKIRMDTTMQFNRGGQTLRQSITVETRETPSGQLDRFTETLTSGALKSTTLGTVSSDEMRLSTENTEQTTTKQIKWPQGNWGPMGIHQMLLRKPMVPGEARRAEVFLPQTHQLAKVTLVAGKTENTTSPEGLLADVVPIDVIMQLEKEGIRIRMWSDAQGHVQKTIWPEGLNLSSFRISRESAYKLQAEDEIATYVGNSLPCDSMAVGLSDAKQAQYAIMSTKTDPHDLFSRESNQVVKPKPVYETFVSVFRPNWESPASSGPKQLEPSLKELSSSQWLPSDSPQIERLAQKWIGRATEPIDRAKMLLEATHRLRKLEFRADIHPVEVVAQNLEGNCVEQAMLLAVLLRNQKIPARIASGVRLSQHEPQPKFEYHMWTEAWLNDQWIPMDATTGTLTSCAYLKFIDTSLSDSDPYGAVLSVLRHLELLKITGITNE